MRRLATLVFIMNTLFYMAVVVYAPAIALAGVTSLRLWPFILLVGVVSTVYTAAGFIYAGLGIIILRGTAQAGGLAKVLAVSEQTGRLWAAFRLHPSLLQYNNVWVATFGGFLQWTCIYGLNQMAMQRYCSMPSLRHARVVLSLTIPANLVIQLMIGYIGLLMVAYFDKCNPLALAEVKTVDQVTILMASRIFEGVPGLPGMFLATIFSATLSTASSVPLKELSDARKSAVMKGISVFFGVLATGMAFACTNLGGIFNVVLTIIGATSGPLVGLFFLGIFFPGANKIGAFVAFVLSTVGLLFCTLMSNVQMPYRKYAITAYGAIGNESAPAAACVAYEGAEAFRRANSSAHFMSTHGTHLHFGDPDSFALSKLSPFSYSSLGVLLVLFIGVPTSWVFRQRLSPLQKRLTFACTYKGLEEPFAGRGGSAVGGENDGEGEAAAELRPLDKKHQKLLPLATEEAADCE
uniref:Sodium/solute symporter n=1 Tax=Globodera rostochiensis TaxID=31243 RepID=A0A914HJ04_GLORO